MTTDEIGNQLVYDAWNRLVEVQDSGSNTLASYSYNALGERTSQTENSTTTDLYYSANWQVLEEQVSGNTTTQYVWSPVYVDAMILRDHDTNGDGTLDQRLWVQQDANFNITALLDNSGSVVERYVEDAFGSFTIYNSDWSSTRSSSSYAWLYIHQGLRYDNNTGLYGERERDYSASQGRFTENDPLGLQAGDTNLYRSLANNPANATDPSGLFWSWASAGIGAVTGAAIGAVGYVAVSAVTGQDITWQGAAGAAVGGAVSGAIVGGAVGALTGDVSAVVVIGVGIGAGGVGGVLGGGAQSATTQYLTHPDHSVNWRQVGYSAAWGGGIGAVTGGISAGLGGGAGGAIRPGYVLNGGGSVACQGVTLGSVNLSTNAARQLATQTAITTTPAVTIMQMSTGGTTSGTGGTPTAQNQPLWTATKNKTPVQNAFRHFRDHGADFGAQNALDYVRQAISFLRNPPPGTLTRIRPNNGDVVRYNPNTNTFGVMDANGAPRTFFKPNPNVHGYPTNMDYFNAQ